MCRLQESEMSRPLRAIITSLLQWRRLLPCEPRRYASNLDFPIQVALPSLAIIENLEGDSTRDEHLFSDTPALHCNDHFVVCLFGYTSSGSAKRRSDHAK